MLRRGPFFHKVTIRHMKYASEGAKIPIAQKLTSEIINAAIEGLEARKIRLDDQIAELRGLLTGDTGGNGSTADQAATEQAEPGKPRKFSAAARRRMKEA